MQKGEDGVMMLFKANPCSRAELSEMAWRVRKFSGYTTVPAFPIVELIEHKLMDYCPLVVLEDSECGDKEAWIVSGQREIYVRDSVYEAAVNGNPRARFTLAHELGHRVFHTIKQIMPCSIEDMVNLKLYQDPEWQADAFAGELLAPTRMIQGLSISEICDQFAVSYDCARIQYELHQRQNLRNVG